MTQPDIGPEWDEEPPIAPSSRARVGQPRTRVGLSNSRPEHEFESPTQRQGAPAARVRAEPVRAEPGFLDRTNDDDQPTIPIARLRPIARPTPVRRPVTARDRPPGATSAGKAMVVVLLGLLVAGLLNSAAMVRATENLPPGWRRTAVRAVAVPLDATARTLRLDRPRARLDTALHRDRDEPAAVTAPKAVAPAAPKKARPSPKAKSTTSPAKPARPRGAIPVTAKKPLRLLVTGDSMIESFGPALVNRIDDGGKVKARIDVKYGTGLVRLEVFDWLAHARQLAAAKSDVAIVMMGGNDGQNMTARGKRLDTETTEWRSEYTRRAGTVMATLTAGGRRVFWVGMPIPRSPTMRRRYEALNSALRDAAAANPLVTYVDIWADFAHDGRYADYLPGPGGGNVRVRSRDGIHLSKQGADRLADKLRGLLLKEWRL